MRLRSRKRSITSSVSVTNTSQALSPKHTKKRAVTSSYSSLGAKNFRQKIPVLCTRSESTTHATSDSKVLLRYPTLIPARLIRRYKRFLADVVLHDEKIKNESTTHDRAEEVVTVYCPNTGPMVGLLEGLPHARVQLSKSDDSKRKYAYTLEMIEIYNGEKYVWVGVHSTMANRMVEQALATRLFSELGDYDVVKREVKFSKNSRVDFVLTTYDHDGTIAHEKYVEVKSVTLALSDSADTLSRCAMFPDTVSIRAQKHVAELTKLLQDQIETEASNEKVSGAIIFLVQRDDCNGFAPSVLHDKKFASLCTVAKKKGVQLLGYSCALIPDEKKLSGIVQLLGPLSLRSAE
ncbi:Sugar fermentation stimulation protein [Plasmopara halstedii]|uniref:Sugar fermentation stimulation protein n=1 Tax=Plasmopara halstedii TaxID=4781 RepID=A0A0P1B005_PLAHL|nr:Sugar fermentation stimulation protein [Plasmopara halstedii]CEG47682.1 Sugar fermentation stimulation protein [Plasmopara halstedii]|eukprot:XP_024584051.1 Sugar fermentation stimulation protein [Plasmopara halstedii]